MMIAVALSGGVDSLVAAYRLKQAGFPIIGIHFLTGYEGLAYGSGEDAGTADSLKSHPIHRISDQLEIPMHIIDCRSEFENTVVDYFIRTYRLGKTPNPCVLCNHAIKFGAVFEAARRLGADVLATGHYARTEVRENRLRLVRGVDEKKDQSYFLSMLTYEQLLHAKFPLGSLRKDQVRQIAAENNLIPLSKKESQDVCFIKEATYADFLEAKGGIGSRPGDIVDPDGNLLGQHQGLHRYTIGQRRGINCPAEAPYYVLRMEPEKNRLIVGFKKSLYKDACPISGVNWLIPKPDGPMAVRAHIRYRHKGADAVIEPGPGNSALIRFKKSQPAITPGQAAVCYLNDTVVAAGWILDT